LKFTTQNCVAGKLQLRFLVEKFELCILKHDNLDFWVKIPVKKLTPKKGLPMSYMTHGTIFLFWYIIFKPKD